MVVPHSTGQLVRSMVRVPGSGIDREATPSCLDLSNVSSLAASVYVPKSLPRALVRPRQPTTPAGKAAKLTDERHLEILGTVLDKNGAKQETSGETASNSAKNQKRTSSEFSNCSERNSSNPPPKKARNSNSKPPQLQFASAPGLAIGQPVQLLLIPGVSGVVLQTQLQQSSGTVSSAPLACQMSTAAVQLPTVLVQPNYASNSPVMQIGIPQAALQMNHNKTDNVKGAVATTVQVKQLTNSSNSGTIPKVSSPQELPDLQSQPPSQGTFLVKQLLQERNRLKAENESLQLTLTKYQNLFKNKESLQKIARYLAEEAKA